MSSTRLITGETFSGGKILKVEGYPTRVLAEGDPLYAEAVWVVSLITPENTIHKRVFVHRDDMIDNPLVQQ